MFKLTIVITSAAMFYGVWIFKRVNARRRLEEIDSGKRCLSCEGTDVQVREGVAHCQSCGHAESLAALNRVKLSSDEIAAMTRPDNSSRL